MSEMVQDKKPKPLVAVRAFLDARAAEIRTALPAHISPERFVRIVMTAIQINPELLACDRQSLWNACMRCANDGLLPDGRDAALVPFKGKVTYIPMYSGILRRFRNSGNFRWITAGIVFDGDEYDHFISEEGERFRHRPQDDTTGKKIRRVYAIATTKDGASFIADLPLADIEKRRKMSRASREDSPWRQWPEEMMKKTAIRVLSKLLPMSSDLDVLMRRDEEALLGIEAVEDTRAALNERQGTQSALDHFAQEEAEVDKTAPEADKTRAETDEDTFPGDKPSEPAEEASS